MGIKAGGVVDTMFCPPPEDACFSGSPTIVMEKYGELVSINAMDLPQKELKRLFEDGVVVGDAYFTRCGQPIRFGEYIKLGFAGGPCDMPLPWTLVSARNCFTTVSYRNMVVVTVRAASGNERSYENASHYSPKGAYDAEYFQWWLKALDHFDPLYANVMHCLQGKARTVTEIILQEGS